MRKVVVLSLVLFMVATAGAYDIYASNNLGNGGPGANENVLVKFDSATPGTWTNIGPMGVPTGGFGGLDFAGNQLYGYISYTTTSGLYKVNTATGATTVVGTLSGQPLQDLAYDPVRATMYGINSNTLYSVNLTTGGVTLVGTITGYTGGLEVGLAFDAQGYMYPFDLVTDIIYKSTTPGGLAVTQLYATGLACNYSQGMTINWAGDNMGYHAALGTSPQYFSSLYKFNTAGTSYALVGHFTPLGTFPTMECGDLAIIPEPASLLLLGALALLRRR